MVLNSRNSSLHGFIRIPVMLWGTFYRWRDGVQQRLHRGPCRERCRRCCPGPECRFGRCIRPDRMDCPWQRCNDPARQQQLRLNRLLSVSVVIHSWHDVMKNGENFTINLLNYQPRPHEYQLPEQDDRNFLNKSFLPSAQVRTMTLNAYPSIGTIS